MKRTVLAAALLVLVATACFPSVNTTGPYTDTNANGLHDSGENINCASLPVYTGSTFLDVPGTVLSGYQINSSVAIETDHVTLKGNCIFGNDDAIVKIESAAATNDSVSDNIIGRLHSPTKDGTCQPTNQDPLPGCRADIGIYVVYTSPGPHVITGNNISDTVHGINMAGDNLTVVGNYVHDMAVIRIDPVLGDHIDGIITNGGSHNLDIEMNTISLTPTDHQTTSLAIYEDGYRCGTPNTPCPNDGIKVLNNLIKNGGQYCIYTPIHTSTNIRIEGNHFGPYCETGGTLHGNLDGSQVLNGTQFPLNTGNTWTGNVWDDDNTTIGKP